MAADYSSLHYPSHIMRNVEIMFNMEQTIESGLLWLFTLFLLPLQVTFKPFEQQVKQRLFVTIQNEIDQISPLFAAHVDRPSVVEWDAH